jgi:hypothetical protein
MTCPQDPAPVPASRARRGVALALAVAALGACRETIGPDTDQRFPDYTVTIRGGDGQTGATGSLLAEPLQVTVQDATTSPVAGVPVRFRIQRGAGAGLTDTVEATGTDGVARAELRLGTAAGDTVRVLAFVPGQESRGVTFRAVPTRAPRCARYARPPSPPATRWC